MPKGTDLSVHTEENMAAFAGSLNNGPRMTLEYLKTIGETRRTNGADLLNPPMAAELGGEMGRMLGDTSDRQPSRLPVPQRPLEPRSPMPDDARQPPSRYLASPCR